MLIMFFRPEEDYLFSLASLPVVLGDFGCDVTYQACRENSPRKPRAITLGSKPPPVTRIARTGLVTRLCSVTTELCYSKRMSSLVKTELTNVSKSMVLEYRPKKRRGQLKQLCHIVMNVF